MSKFNFLKRDHSSKLDVYKKDNKLLLENNSNSLYSSYGALLETAKSTSNGGRMYTASVLRYDVRIPGATITRAGFVVGAEASGLVAGYVPLYLS